MTPWPALTMLSAVVMNATSCAGRSARLCSATCRSSDRRSENCPCSAMKGCSSMSLQPMSGSACSAWPGGNTPINGMSNSCCAAMPGPVGRSGPMPKSASPEATRASTLSTAQSARRSCTPGCAAPKAAITSGSSVQAISCGAAMRTTPLCSACRSCRSPSAASRSRKIFSITGTKPFPASVSATERVLRSTDRTPTCSSNSLTSPLSADCVRCSAAAAWVKLPVCASATRARSCRRLTFITKPSQCILKNRLNDR